MLMAIQYVLLTNLLIVAGLVLGLWVLSLILGNVSIVDLFWGPGFVVLSWASLALGTSEPSTRGTIIAVLMTIWGLRLAGYLIWRNWGQPEDYRYRAMRDRHGERFPLRSLFTVFLLQGCLIWFIGLPLQIGLSQPRTWWLPMSVGFVVWLVGIFFEAVGDYQLARFKAKQANRGRVMDRGLWRYTRHPNYFGDFLVWWGVFLMVTDSATWWWTIMSPLLMSFLLIRVSGVRLLEGALKSRVEGYEAYVRSTSSFFPLPPKNS